MMGGGAMGKKKTYLQKLSLWKRGWKRDWQIYLLLAPTLIYLLVFSYMPMYGLQIAFRYFKAKDGIAGSSWVGLWQYEKFFSSYYWQRLLENTVVLNVANMFFLFPFPIILALMIKQVNGKKVKKFVQTVVCAPHFVSLVVLMGILSTFLSPTYGVVNKVIEALGGEAIDFLARPQWFRPIYILSGIWQATGWSSIIYLATLTGIDPGLYEAATIDGANNFQKMWYIDIPSLKSMVVFNLIMMVGGIMGNDWQKAFLMSNGGNISKSDILGTYVYNVGIGNALYSYATAIGLIQSLINFIMVMVVNKIANKVGEKGSEKGIW